MLTVMRDDQGQLQAACEWEAVNAQGLPNVDGTQGTPDTFCYIKIERIELGAGGHFQSVYAVLIEALASEMPDAKGAYWQSHHSQTHRMVSRTRNQFVQSVIELGAEVGYARQ